MDEATPSTDEEVRSYAAQEHLGALQQANAELIAKIGNAVPTLPLHILKLRIDIIEDFFTKTLFDPDMVEVAALTIGVRFEEALNTMLADIDAQVSKPRLLVPDAPSGVPIVEQPRQ